MPVNEYAALIDGPPALVAILTEPPEGAPSDEKPAVILLNAGLVHRVGPNRLYVHLARRLAAQGFPAVRFDHSAVGDSPARTDSMPFGESSILETQQVMDWAHRRSGAARFCLMGLCSGAVTAFRTACRDRRVAGAALLNARGLGGETGWIGHVENRWQAREYVRKLFTKKGIWKVATGRAPYARALEVARKRYKDVVRGAARASGTAAAVGSEMQALIERGVRLLWLSSAEDSSREYFKLITSGRLAHLRSRDRLRCVTVGRSNHTFDNLDVQAQVLDGIENWALEGWPAPAHSRGERSGK